MHISRHRVFSKIKVVNKPFKELGLSNSLEPLNHKNYQDCYIGFSAEGVKGFWDLATMSMRGVCSCMHWSNNHCVHLIGSLTDPFVGIIYITDKKKTKYGYRFIKRSLVRIIESYTQPNDFGLFIERVYKDTGNTDPYKYDNNDDRAEETREIFTTYLKSKTNTPIIRHSYGYRIPYSSSLSHISFQEESLTDAILTKANVRSNVPLIAKYSIQD